MSSLIVSILLIGIIVASGWLILFYNAMVIQKDEASAKWDKLVLRMDQENHLMKECLEIIYADDEYNSEELKLLMIEIDSLDFNQIHEEMYKKAIHINRLAYPIIEQCEQSDRLKENKELNNLSFQLKALRKDTEISYLSYHQSIQKFNQDIRLFPNNMAAKILGLEALYPFKAE